jgi:uncharacterized protein YbjT (DUF2867 family)
LLIFKVLVTDATGFIGSNLLGGLLKKTTSEWCLREAVEWYIQNA